MHKLATCYCRPFSILQYIGSFAYHLHLLDGVHNHPIFHVSHLKELLVSNDNMVFVNDLVTLKDLAYKPHVPKCILDSKTKTLPSKSMPEFRIKWLDRTIDNAIWEKETTSKTQFPTFHCKSAFYF